MMNDKLRHSFPAVEGCRRSALSDSGMVCQYNYKRVKSARRKRLEIHRMKSPTGENIASDDNFSENRTSDLILSNSSPSDHSSGNDVMSSHGLVSVIGRRREMEDAVGVKLGFLTRDSREYDFYGVYDGHGGARVAHACRDRLHRLLVREIETVWVSGSMVDWEKAMVASFGEMDKEVSDCDRRGMGEENEALSATVGSTAVVAVVGEEEVVVANCGDSRAVMSRGGVTVVMSEDHKPDRPDELERIEAAGGRVINWNGNRVLGVLATSRSIGDHYLKPFVIPKPEVKVIERTSADELLILATDGLWDVISNEFACQVVRRCLEGRVKRRFQAIVNEDRYSEALNESRAEEAAAVLAELAIARGSKDNISVVVVDLNKTRKCTV